jgi:tRNA dimethylallyltransferase
LPIIVGGTGLWVEALLEGYRPAPKVSQKIRKELLRELKNDGLGSLVGKLRKVDKLAYQKVDLKNPRRVLRALEVFLSTGKSIFEQRKKKASQYDYILIGPKVSRDELYKRIDQRVEKMFKAGLEKEVRDLYKKFGKVEALNAIGHKEFFPQTRACLPARQGFAADSTDTPSAGKVKDKIKKNTRNLAKRQMTWWRRKQVKWVGTKVEAVQIVKKWLKV